MSRNVARTADTDAVSVEVDIAGERIVCDHRGVIYVPDLRLLTVSDLHLEKGSSLARRGVFVPPYDSAATLLRLQAVIADYDPRTVVALGDSFHDIEASARLPGTYRDQLRSLMAGREWIWIAGNHDPDAPSDLDGSTVAEIAVGALQFRHEPGPGSGFGEIAGHLHPGARIVRRGRSVRRACFASDGARLILPAFGAFTGTLNVLDAAYRGLFSWAEFRAHMIGRDPPLHGLGKGAVSRLSNRAAG